MKRREIRAKYDEIVEFSGVEQFIDTPVKRYSSGMYVRLAFAVAAHLEPEVLLIDEVLAVGDHEFQQRCMGRIEDISESGRTVIFVSHDMQAIARLCDRAYWLDSGRVVAEGPSEEIVAQYLQSASGTANAWQNPKFGQPLGDRGGRAARVGAGRRPARGDGRHRRRPRARGNRVPVHRLRARAALPEDQARDDARRGRLQRLRRRPPLGDARRAGLLRQYRLDPGQPPQRGLHDAWTPACSRSAAPKLHPLRQPAGSPRRSTSTTRARATPPRATSPGSCGAPSGRCSSGRPSASTRRLVQNTRRLTSTFVERRSGRPGRSRSSADA